MEKNFEWPFLAGDRRNTRCVSFFTCAYADAEDFDPDVGFSKGPEAGDGEEWEGEDEGLVIEEDKQETKSTCELKGRRERCSG